MSDVNQQVPVTDGWIQLSDVWTFASATTITVPSGATTRYAVGDKIRPTQTTVKYFYIIAVASTLLTISGGTDYTLANASIVAPAYSHAESPSGFPGQFNYTATTGASGSMTWTSIAATTRFWMVRNQVHLFISLLGTTGGTPSTDLTFTLPFVAAAATSFAGGLTVFDTGSRRPGFYINVGSASVVTVSKGEVLLGALVNWGAGANTGFIISNGIYQL